MNGVKGFMLCVGVWEYGAGMLLSGGVDGVDSG